MAKSLSLSASGSLAAVKNAVVEQVKRAKNSPDYIGHEAVVDTLGASTLKEAAKAVEEAQEKNPGQDVVVSISASLYINATASVAPPAPPKKDKAEKAPATE